MFFKKTFVDQSELLRQIDEFVSYKRKRSSWIANHHKEWLLIFLKVCNKRNVLEVEEKDLHLFYEILKREYSTSYFHKEAIHTLKNFLKFYGCDKVKIHSKLTVK